MILFAQKTERFCNIFSIIPTPLTEKRFYYQNTWKDQVTKIEYYTGPYLSYTQNFNYDSSGNPTFIDDSRAAKDIILTWEGRGLTTYTKGNESLVYRYNDQGIRTYKAQTINGQTVVTTYTLDGHHVLVEERSDGTTLYFTYDVDGSLLSMNYNGTEYFYITNIQGDIIELVDINWTSVVKYNYDAWGNTISQTGGSLAEINPYRYRGYRYDNETGWYYLQSRYYNPTIGRFINADGLLGEVGDPLNHNVYAYCANNPVIYLNTTGYNSNSTNNSRGNNTVSSDNQIYSSKNGLLNRNSVSGEVRSGAFYGKGESTFLYGTSQFRFQWSNGKRGEKTQIGYFTKISILNAAGQIGFETGGYGVALKGVADVGTATLLIGYMETDKGWFVGLSVEASIASARGGFQFDIGQFGIEIGGSAKLMTTGEFQFGVGSDGFVFALGNPGPGGVSIYIRLTW